MADDPMRQAHPPEVDASPNRRSKRKLSETLANNEEERSLSVSQPTKRLKLSDYAEDGFLSSHFVRFLEESGERDLANPPKEHRLESIPPIPSPTPPMLSPSKQSSIRIGSSSLSRPRPSAKLRELVSKQSEFSYPIHLLGLIKRHLSMVCGGSKDSTDFTKLTQWAAMEMQNAGTPAPPLLASAAHAVSELANTPGGDAAMVQDRRRHRNYVFFLRLLDLLSSEVIGGEEFVNMVSVLFEATELSTELRRLLHVPLRYQQGAALYARPLRSFRISDSGWGLRKKGSRHSSNNAGNHGNSGSSAGSSSSSSSGSSSSLSGSSSSSSSSSSNGGSQRPRISSSASTSSSSAVSVGADGIEYCAAPMKRVSTSYVRATYGLDSVSSGRDPLCQSVLNNGFVSVCAGSEAPSHHEQNQSFEELYTAESRLCLWDYYYHQNEIAIQSLRRLQTAIVRNCSLRAAMDGVYHRNDSSLPNHLDYYYDYPMKKNHESQKKKDAMNENDDDDSDNHQNQQQRRRKDDKEEEEEKDLINERYLPLVMSELDVFNDFVTPLAWSAIRRLYDADDRTVPFLIRNCLLRNPLCVIRTVLPRLLAKREEWRSPLKSSRQFYVTLSSDLFTRACNYRSHFKADDKRRCNPASLWNELVFAQARMDPSLAHKLGGLVQRVSRSGSSSSLSIGPGLFSNPLTRRSQGSSKSGSGSGNSGGMTGQSASFHAMRVHRTSSVCHGSSVKPSRLCWILPTDCEEYRSVADGLVVTTMGHRDCDCALGADQDAAARKAAKEEDLLLDGEIKDDNANDDYYNGGGSVAGKTNNGKNDGINAVTSNSKKKSNNNNGSRKKKKKGSSKKDASMVGKKKSGSINADNDDDDDDEDAVVEVDRRGQRVYSAAQRRRFKKQRKATKRIRRCLTSSSGINDYYNFSMRFSMDENDGGSMKSDCNDESSFSSSSCSAAIHEHCWNILVDYFENHSREEKGQFVEFWMNFGFLFFGVELNYSVSFPELRFPDLVDDCFVDEDEDEQSSDQDVIMEEQLKDITKSEEDGRGDHNDDDGDGGNNEDENEEAGHRSDTSSSSSSEDDDEDDEPLVKALYKPPPPQPSSHSSAAHSHHSHHQSSTVHPLHAIAIRDKVIKKSERKGGANMRGRQQQQRRQHTIPFPLDQSNSANVKNIQGTGIAVNKHVYSSLDRVSTVSFGDLYKSISLFPSPRSRGDSGSGHHHSSPSLKSRRRNKRFDGNSAYDDENDNDDDRHHHHSESLFHSEMDSDCWSPINLSIHDRKSRVIIGDQFLYTILRLYITLFDRIRLAKSLCSKDYSIRRMNSKEKNDSFASFFQLLFRHIDGSLTESKFEQSLYDLFGSTLAYELVTIKNVIQTMVKEFSSYVSRNFDRLIESVNIWKQMHDIWVNEHNDDEKEGGKGGSVMISQQMDRLKFLRYYHRRMLDFYRVNSNNDYHRTAEESSSSPVSSSHHHYNLNGNENENNDHSSQQTNHHHNNTNINSDSSDSPSFDEVKFALVQIEYFCDSKECAFQLLYEAEHYYLERPIRALMDAGHFVDLPELVSKVYSHEYHNHNHTNDLSVSKQQHHHQQQQHQQVCHRYRKKYNRIRSLVESKAPDRKVLVKKSPLMMVEYDIALDKEASVMGLMTGDARGSHQSSANHSSRRRGGKSSGHSSSYHSLSALVSNAMSNYSNLFQGKPACVMAAYYPRVMESESHLIVRVKDPSSPNVITREQRVTKRQRRKDVFDSWHRQRLSKLATPTPRVIPSAESATAAVVAASEVRESVVTSPAINAAAYVRSAQLASAASMAGLAIPTQVPVPPSLQTLIRPAPVPQYFYVVPQTVVLPTGMTPLAFAAHQRQYQMAAALAAAQQQQQQHTHQQPPPQPRKRRDN